MSYRKLPAATLLCVICLLAGAVHSATNPRICPGGRFVIEGSPLVVTADIPPIASISIADGMAELLGICPAVEVRVRPRRRGTRIRAVFKGCPGVRGRMKLAGLILSPDCTRLSGKITATKRRVSRRFVATLMTASGACGDGHIDPGEACDDGNVQDCDGCKGDCSRADASCGDGVVECGESCEPPGTGGCDLSCRVQLACGEPGVDCCTPGRACDLRSPDGVVVAFPAGAFESPTAARLASVGPAALPPSVADAVARGGFLAVAAFELSLSSDARRPAQVTVPNRLGTFGLYALLLRVLPDVQPPATVVVELAADFGDEIVTASPPFPGLRSSGTYVVVTYPGFVGTPVFGRGVVRRDDGSPAADVLVQSLTSPFPSLTGSDGSYVAHLGILDTDLPTVSTLIAEAPPLIGSLIAPIPPDGRPLPPPDAITGVIIIPIDGPIIIIFPGSGPTPDERAAEIASEFCMACRDKIVRAVEEAATDVREAIEIAVKLAGPTHITFPEGPLTLEVGESDVFWSNPIELKATDDIEVLQPRENVCSGYAFKVASLKVYPAALVVGNLVVVRPDIATLGKADVIPGEWAIDSFFRRTAALRVPLRGDSRGSTLLKGVLHDARFGVEAKLELSDVLAGIRIQCPGTDVDLPFEPEVDATRYQLEWPITVYREEPPPTPKPDCGNGTIDFEMCDGDDLGGRSCESLGFASGTLRCRADCTLDLSACVDPIASGRAQIIWGAYQNEGHGNFVDECSGFTLEGLGSAVPPVVWVSGLSGAGALWTAGTRGAGAVICDCNQPAGSDCVPDADTTVVVGGTSIGVSVRITSCRPVRHFFEGRLEEEVTINMFAAGGYSDPAAGEILIVDEDEGGSGYYHAKRVTKETGFACFGGGGLVSSAITTLDEESGRVGFIDLTR